MPNCDEIITPEIFVSSIFQYLRKKDLCNVKLTCKKRSTYVDSFRTLEDKKGNIFYFIFIAPATVWKFNDFSITQILRKTNFWDCRSATSANFVI